MTIPRIPYSHDRHRAIEPLASPINRGYDNTGQPNGQGSPLWTKPGSQSWVDARNGWITNQFFEHIPLIIEEVETGFEMGGSTAQSRTYRQFFPRNFTKPLITVRGRMVNDFEYNRLASMVRVSHLASLDDGFVPHSGLNTRTDTNGDYLPTITLSVFRGGYAGRTVKGPHRPWRVEGYIKRIDAGAQRHNPAPPFEFDFVVAYSHDGYGLYHDEPIEGSDLVSWTQVFNATQSGNSFTPTNQGNSPSRTGGGSQSFSSSAEQIVDNAAEDISQALFGR